MTTAYSNHVFRLLSVSAWFEGHASCIHSGYAIIRGQMARQHEEAAVSLVSIWYGCWLRIDRAYSLFQLTDSYEPQKVLVGWSIICLKNRVLFCVVDDERRFVSMTYGYRNFGLSFFSSTDKYIYKFFCIFVFAELAIYCYARLVWAKVYTAFYNVFRV